MRGIMQFWDSRCPPNVPAHPRREATRERRVDVWCSRMLCRPFLLNTWLGHCAGEPRERAQRFVHGSRVRKEICDVRVEQVEVGPLSVASCRYPSHGLREIVLGPHRVLVFATFPNSFVLHIGVSLAEWRGEN